MLPFLIPGRVLKALAKIAPKDHRYYSLTYVRFEGDDKATKITVTDGRCLVQVRVPEAFPGDGPMHFAAADLLRVHVRSKAYLSADGLLVKTSDGEQTLPSTDASYPHYYDVLRHPEPPAVDTLHFDAVLVSRLLGAVGDVLRGYFDNGTDHAQMVQMTPGNLACAPVRLVGCAPDGVDVVAVFMPMSSDG